MSKKLILCLFNFIFIGVINMTANASPQAEKAAVDQVLNSFHEAAAKADGKTYFSLFAEEGVFLGTDATERWSVEEFRKYAEPFFSKGKGWSYKSRVRHVDFSPDAKVAWFDELLDNANYGECRGSGVLRKTSNGWKISQYHLTIPVPNELADDVVTSIRKLQVKAKK